MRRPARVGIVGCGVISRRYAANAAAFDSFDVVACADVDAAQAQALADEHGLVATTVEGLLADDGVDVVLDLTPAGAHAAVNAAALDAGKHVYSEKPLAATVAEARELVAQAERLGLRLGSAPDTFLSGPYQAARAFLDEGRLGEPLSVIATVHAGGPESWHPHPDGFYRPGAGPLFDVGPYYLTAFAALLGPVRRATGFASTRQAERTIATGPRAGERFAVTTPTHVTAALEFASGATGTFVASFEATDQYIPLLTIYGTKGALALPDPNGFDGELRFLPPRGDWESLPYASRGDRDDRGIGLHDMVEAIADGRPHRASAGLALHVLDVAATILASAADGRALDVSTTCDPVEPLPVAA